MKKTILFLLLLAILSTGCNRAGILEQRVLRMTAAHNRNDVSREIDFFADDAVFIIEGWEPAVGTAVLRDVFACDSVLNCELVFQGLTVRGDTVFVDMVTERNDFYRLAGLPEVRYAPGTKIVFRKDLIEEVELSPIVPQDQKALNDFSSGFAAWVREEHPDLMEEFSRSMELVNHSAKSAQLWIKLLTEYRASEAGEK